MAGVSGDGCSADCAKVESGWVCKTPGVRCQPKCGDGVMTGWEECDDGNAKPGDGCVQSCTVEAGFACPTSGAPCHETVCGDDVQEGSESCDDGNTMPGDGCAPDCKSEPICTGTSGCTSPCGDGLKLPDEECDDGNLSLGRRVLGQVQAGAKLGMYARGRRHGLRSRRSNSLPGYDAANCNRLPGAAGKPGTSGFPRVRGAWFRISSSTPWGPTGSRNTTRMWTPLFP